MTRRKSVSALLLLTLLFTACGETVQQTPIDSDPVANSDDITTVDDALLSDNLPDDLDFNGRELRILSSQEYEGFGDGLHMLLVTENSGDILDDAIYQRNLKVMERFGVTFVETPMTYNEAHTLVRTSVSAGDDVYDVISLADRNALSLVAEGMIYYMDELPYIDLEREYWNQTLNESITIADRQVLAYSDMMLTAYDFTHLLSFNKAMIDELSLDDPYTLVDSGKWTLDRFNEYLAAATSDLNGDTIYDENDRYGFVSDAKQVSPCFWIAAGCLSIEKDDSDIPRFVMNSERMLNTLDRVYQLTWENNYWYKQLGVEEIGYTMFSNGQALFCNASFDALFGGIFRASNIEYGVIPYPKYDESQERYYTRVEGGFPYVVPVTVNDTEFVGAMLEALACESHNTVLPAYYEVALKTKYTRDDTSARILDMIMEGRIYDFGDTFLTGNVRDGFVAQTFSAGQPMTASKIESNTATVEAAIGDIVEAVTGE